MRTGRGDRARHAESAAAVQASSVAHLGPRRGAVAGPAAAGVGKGIRVIDLDHGSAVPPFEQIRAQIAEHVDSDVLQAGDRLPTVRRLAEDLGVAPGTVARAYRELEQSGVIETRGRGGTFVMGDRVASLAKAAAVAYMAETKALGLSAADALMLIRNLSKQQA